MVQHDVTITATRACPTLTVDRPISSTLAANQKVIQLGGGYYCTAVEMTGPGGTTGVVELDFPLSMQADVGAATVTPASTFRITAGHKGTAIMAGPVTRKHNFWVNISFTGLAAASGCPPVELARSTTTPAELVLDISAPCQPRSLRIARSDATAAFVEIETKVLVDSGHVDMRCCAERGGKLEVVIKSTYRFVNERDEVSLVSPSPSPDQIRDPDEPQTGFGANIQYALRSAVEGQVYLAVFDGNTRIATSGRRRVQRGSSVEVGVLLPVIPIGPNTVAFTIRAFLEPLDRTELASEPAEYKVASLILDHIEVVQVVQSAANSVPLVRGKPTMVRVFVRSRARTRERINLRASLAGRDLSGLRRLDDLRPSQSPLFFDSSVNRTSSLSDFRFRLPDTWFRLAQLELEPRFVTPRGTAFTKASLERAKLTVEFKDFPGWAEPLRVAYQVLCREEGCPAEGPLAAAGEFPSKIFPMAPRNFVYFPFEQSRTRLSAAALSDDPVISLILQREEFGELAAALGGAKYDYLISWFQIGSIGADYSKTGMVLVDPDETVTAQRLGLGLFNLIAGNSSDGPTEIGADPVENRIIPDPYPLWLWDPSGGSPSRRWITAPEYLQLIEQPPVHKGALRKGSDRAAEGELPAILVRVRARRNGSPAAILGALPFQAVSAPRVSSRGDYCLEFVREASVLGVHCFDPVFRIDGSDETVVPVVTAFPGGADSMRLTVKAVPTGEVRKSAEAPSIEILSPVAGAIWSGGGSRTIEWRASDADGDSLQYTLLYSSDNGSTWLPLAIFTTATRHELDTSSIRGGDRVMFRVIASDGFHGTATTAGPIEIRQTPKILAEPSPVAFPATVLQSSTDASVTLSNTGDGPLTIRDIRSGNPAVARVLESYPLILPAGSKRSLKFQFTPESEGETSGFIAIDSDDPVQPELRIPVRARGVSSAEPEITVTPATIDFGSLETGRTRNASFTLRNNGAAPLRVTAVGGPAVPFMLAAVATPFDLGPGDQRTLSVEYRPVSAGTHAASVAVTSDDPRQPRLEIPLRGVATQAGGTTPPPTGGGGGSGSGTGFTITSLSPDRVIAGDTGFTLTVEGRGFTTESVVRLNTVNRPTTFVSATRLTALIPRSDIATALTPVRVTVANPASAGGVSNELTLTIDSPPLPTPSLQIQQIETRACPDVKALVSFQDAQRTPLTPLPPIPVTCAEDGVAARCSGMVTETPLSVVFVVGTNGASTQEIEAAKAAARAILDRLGADDRAGLIHIEDVARQISPVTSGRAAVRTGIDGLRESGSGHALNEAVSLAANLLAAETGRRKAIILISHRDNQGGSATESAALSAARNSGVPVFGFVHGAAMNGGGLGAFLRTLAAESNGIRYTAANGSELLASAERTSAVLRSQIEVSYQAAGASAKTLSVTIQGNTGTRTRPACGP